MILSFAFIAALGQAAVWTEENDPYNLNKNKLATDSLDFTAEWNNHIYHPSPQNWRIPFYSLMLDRFADGDPVNNDIFQTLYEYDSEQVNFHHGGDCMGLVNRLDYLETLGIKGIYLAGTPLLNMPYDWHKYNPIDLSLLDPHLGSVDEWRYLVDKIHSRDMLVIVDLTIETLGDLLAFENHVNKSTPLNLNGYNLEYKSNRRYSDFFINNTWDAKCNWPTFYDVKTGYPKPIDVPKGCYNDDFAHYGDLEAFGDYDAWERQVTKFNGVQDRLRDWSPSLAQKLVRFSCLLIEGIDIDGIRVDKATQMTLDFATKVWATGVRECARKLGKNNFFIPGEITSAINLGSMYIGRGRLAHQRPNSVTEATSTSSKLGSFSFRLEHGMDSEAFHYSIYRGLLSMMGLEGNILAEGDTGDDMIEAWNEFLIRVDYFNSFTKEFDPRDMFGASNQDTFRWPSLELGIERQSLLHFIIVLVLPGIPVINFGEEQHFYIHDSRSENYIYGRQPFTSSKAWQLHGCFTGNASYQFRNMPFNEKSRTGCLDASQSMDHANPTSASFLFVQNLLEIREQYNIFVDSFGLETMTKLALNGKKEFLWSVKRTYLPFQRLIAGVKVAWILFSNSAEAITLNGCQDESLIISPFAPEIQLVSLTTKNQIATVKKNANNVNCLEKLSLPPFGFQLFLEQNFAIPPSPKIVDFKPGHDARIDIFKYPSLEIQLQFSSAMVCDAIAGSITWEGSEKIPKLDAGSIVCDGLIWRGVFEDLPEAILKLTVQKGILSKDGIAIKKSVSWILRFGKPTNVLVFPTENEFSGSLLSMQENGDIQLHNDAQGSDLYRYSTDYERKWSRWLPYVPLATIAKNEFKYMQMSKSNFYRVSVQYFNSISGSSAHKSHGMLDQKTGIAIDSDSMSRYPCLHIKSLFNKFGNDITQLSNMVFSRTKKVWEFEVFENFPANITVDIWNDGVHLFGDIDNDGVLDRLPPTAQDSNALRLSVPPTGYSGWLLNIDDKSLKWTVKPIGSDLKNMLNIILISAIPIFTGILAVVFYKFAFYFIYVNREGRFQSSQKSPKTPVVPITNGLADIESNSNPHPTILVATLEYDIPEWKIKVRIGGLGVIASLMGVNLQGRLVWVVPMVGDIEYPVPENMIQIPILICQQLVIINAFVFSTRNVTYYLLESPIFRKQTSLNPYPARMNNVESACFYSCWNQCIAHILEIEPIDIYHVNDFHGGLAPFYVHPVGSIRCVLSLHNAEFQGLWPVRTEQEERSLCSIFNLPPTTCNEFIRFGHVFNLLHGIANYISKYQQGIGCGGVSAAYGARCQLRFPALWSLKEMESVENPNPADVVMREDSIVNLVNSKEDCQTWAGLNLDQNATLLMFLGRFSHQKGIDVIADLAGKILSTYQNVQLLCIGPIIDLHGRLSAIKLDHIAKIYPGRLVCKAEFTVIPTFVFEATDFVLIPSRDEPFGLVAVEFGQHGVLGIGSLVGGLGTMPGWWYPMESPDADHIKRQLWVTIKLALKSSESQRKAMRSVAIKQRFPVAEWLVKLDALYQKVLQASKGPVKLRELKLIPLTNKTEVELPPTTSNWKNIESVIDDPNDVWEQYDDIDGELQALVIRNLTERKHELIDSMILVQKRKFYKQIDFDRQQTVCGQTTNGFSNTCQKICNTEILNWPIYGIILCIGQLMGLASFQITIISKASSFDSLDFYLLGIAFIIGCIFWYALYFKKASKLGLCGPFVLYSLAFIGLAFPYRSRYYLLPIQMIYSFASASGPLFFALNFGAEDGSEIKVWIYRSILGESLRQCYVLFLSNWSRMYVSTPIATLTTTIICVPFSALLGMYFILLYAGLPKFYSFTPPSIPNFIRTLFRRNMVLWYWLSEFVKGYWLNGVYGRNLEYFWSRQIPVWSSVVIIIALGALGATLMTMIAIASKRHTWLLPVFSVGLLSPRWAQISFSLSATGLSLYWGGVYSEYIAASVWMWLGVLDSIQAVGISIMLLQTLTRTHLAAALLIGQFIGCLAQLIARAVMFQFSSTGTKVFPNFFDNGFLVSPIFWVGLISQLISSLGFLMWYRRERLSKR